MYAGWPARAAGRACPGASACPPSRPTRRNRCAAAWPITWLGHTTPACRRPTKL